MRPARSDSQGAGSRRLICLVRHDPSKSRLDGTRATSERQGEEAARSSTSVDRNRLCALSRPRGQQRMPHETGNNLPTHQPKTEERKGSRVQREIRTVRSRIQREIRTVRSCREWGIEVWGEGASTDQQAARHRLFTHRLSILVQPVCQTEL